MSLSIDIASRSNSDDALLSSSRKNVKKFQSINLKILFFKDLLVRRFADRDHYYYGRKRMTPNSMKLSINRYRRK